MTLEELTAYLETAGFTRTKPEEPKPEEPNPEEPKPEEEQKPEYASKADITALQTALADLTKTIKANAIATQFLDKPEKDSADDILASVLAGKQGGKDK